MRYQFGADLAAYVIGITTSGTTPNLAQLTAGVTVTFFSAETGGTQYTDLLDDQGNPITAVVSADGTPGGRGLGVLPPFRGPDTIKRMWAQAGSGPRLLIVTNDLDNLIPAVELILPPMTVRDPVTGPAIGLSRIYNDTSATLQLTAVRASAGIAVPATLVLDVRRNGSTIFSTPDARPAITAGAYTSGKVVPAETILFAPGDYLTADVVSGTCNGALVIQVVAAKAGA